MPRQFGDTGCVASDQSSGTAINVGTGSTVRDCFVSSQGTNGLLVASGCLVLNNRCYGYGPGGAAPAIRATGSFNRIEGNSVSAGQSGIQVDGTSNFIVRNIAMQNGTNYSIAPGNCTGTIVTSEVAMNSTTSGNANVSF